VLYWKISVDGDERRKESRLDLLLRSWPPPINVQMDKRETDREAQCIASFKAMTWVNRVQKGFVEHEELCATEVPSDERDRHETLRGY
jgi:hypothetical protein